MFKKSLSLAILLAFVATPVLSVRAQVVSATLTPEAHSALVADIEKKINDLMVQILLAKIAELQVQITELLTQQSTTQAQVANVQSTVDTIGAQSSPSLGASEPTPVSLSLGTPSCAPNYPTNKYKYSDGVSVPISNLPTGTPVTITSDRYQLGVIQGYGDVLRSLPRIAWSITTSHPKFTLPDYPDTYSVTLSGNGIETSTHQLVVPSCQ